MMTPWKHPVDRAHWVLSSRGLGRIPHAPPNHRPNTEIRFERTPLINRYYINRIYDSNLYIVSWCDDYGNPRESRLDITRIKAWLDNTQGMKPPNGVHRSDYMSIQEVSQRYNINDGTIRGVVSRQDEATLQQHTARIKGNKWIISAHLAHRLFANWHCDKVRGSLPRVNLMTFERWTNDYLSVGEIEEHYIVTRDALKNYISLNRDKLEARELIYYQNNTRRKQSKKLTPYLSCDLALIMWGKKNER